MARILLIDDSVFQRKNLAKMLVGMGHEVTMAENGQVGLEGVETDTPDLIVTDLVMPVMDGVSLLRAMKDRGISVPAIVASADVQTATREECLSLGARAFLNKPVSVADMEGAITEALTVTVREETQC